jgi:hypothetical protein
MTHVNLYATLLKHASTYNVGLLHKLARLLKYSEACVYNRKIEHTYTCIHVSRDTRFNKSINTYMHPCRDVCSEGRALASNNASRITRLNGDEAFDRPSCVHALLQV